MISFIVPVYNKGSILFKTINSLINHLNASEFTDFEIIVVNDGSTDNSFGEAIRCKKFNGNTDKIKIFHYTKNIGKGFALRYGFSRSKGDQIVFMDGDMDINTRQVIGALRTFFKRSPDMLIGSKYLKKSRTYYPTIRFIYSLVLRIVIRVLFKLSVTDTQVGLKIFRRNVLTEALPRLIIKRFAVDLELLLVSNLIGYTNIIEYPVVVRYATSHQSTINLVAVKNFCMDVAALFYRKNILHYYDTPSKENTIPYLTVQTA